ncbi:MAG: hypothetical protein KDA65_06645 [Planctomycetaceae bacterium]|nr:hypothetical protein [Planctomycetaceae bacterium]
MPEPDFSRPESAPHPQQTHYQTEDDIELPPLETEPANAASSDDVSPSPDQNQKTGRPSILGTIALIGACLVGTWFLLPDAPSLEEQHPNWQYVEAATNASSSGSDQLVQLTQQGSTQVFSSLELASSDASQAATRELRQALSRNDLVTATALLQQAQELPSPSQNSDVKPPILSADSSLTAALEKGEQELYELELFDCCDEDGDVVEVLVNGVPFATVPIDHSGTKLSIPLAKGQNSITIRGVRDGGGGVTLSFRTSRGDYFARYLDVGEDLQLGVVVK